MVIIVVGLGAILVFGFNSKQSGLANVLAINPRGVLSSENISIAQVKSQASILTNNVDVKDLDIFINNQEVPKRPDFTSIIKEVFSKKETPVQENSSQVISSPSASQGFLSIFHEDDLVHKKSNERAVVFTSDNKVITLDYAAVKKSLPETGSYIKLNGLVKTSGNKYSFANIETISRPSAHSSRSASGPTGKVSVVVFNYLDNQSIPITLADARKKVFDIDPTNHFSIPQWFNTVSYGIMNLVGKTNSVGNGDVYGVYTAPHNNNTCQSVNSSVSSVLSNAKSDGLNISENDIIVFWQPYSQYCGYLGFAAYMPINPSDPQSKLFRYVVMNDSDTGTLMHELGHLMSNAGSYTAVPHANRYRCRDNMGVDTSIGKLTTSSCEVEEYADFFDVMGGVPSNYNYFNNNSRLDAGFLDASNYISVQSSGIYTVTPINDVGTKIIKIPVTVYNPNGTVFAPSESFYTVETRRFDPLVEKYPRNPLANEVFIRQGNRLVTMANGSNILHQGDTFIDEKNQIEIKNLGPASIGSGNTLVQVTIPQQPLVCHLGIPKLTVSPKPSMATYPKSVTLNVNLKNTDIGACPPTDIIVDIGDLSSLYPSYPAHYQSAEIEYLSSQLYTAFSSMKGIYLAGQEKTRSISIPTTQTLVKSLIKVGLWISKSSWVKDPLRSYSSSPAYIGFGVFSLKELSLIMPLERKDITNIDTILINHPPNPTWTGPSQSSTGTY